MSQFGKKSIFFVSALKYDAYRRLFILHLFHYKYIEHSLQLTGPTLFYQTSPKLVIKLLHSGDMQNTIFNLLQIPDQLLFYTPRMKIIIHLQRAFLLVNYFKTNRIESN